MIKDVYELLLSRKNEIEKQISLLDETSNNLLKEKIKEKWKEYCQTQGKLSTVLAIDGGMWIKELRSGIVYIVNAEIVKAEGFNVTPIDSKALIGVLRPGNMAKERVSLLMQLLELKLGLKHGDKAEYILFDGSIVKKIGKHKFSTKISLLDDIDVMDDKIYSLEENDEELMHKYLVAENQLVMSALISKYKGKLVWISKNSKSTELFQENISDVSLLELFTKNCGYTIGIEKKISSENIISPKASTILSNASFYSFYTRLKEGEKILKIEMFNNEIENIISILSPISIKGYPYPLLKVHTDVKVSRQDRERIKQLLNIKKKDIEWWPSQLF
ncbi:DNA double-strand break repair nuclease NurA [Sulfurisphaera tokodaii]|uniref:DNA double-strand break repair nuclease NurA n=2 Tax=Sulfurisphaera tokodaii TaxID=111955 RepID=NURA_SULTO|nr:DNA double-strand break repair nuclease NurA [Sulfurisphaera tokodaii]Q96YR4.1 RecName: Full=DNA double-strand break repair nuclease NurA; AltName: Full=StoNurA [Sulfurisphaera tokodaii str. 7]BAB67213.1 5'-3' nuclease NurA [Sulfurisphaera tokodaii str. 7]HII72942.1 DNA double-strand break repair nuclease NurA [Sulfurisphaera tokodaii]